MTEMQKKMIEKLGIAEKSFEPKATQEERLTTLEVTRRPCFNDGRFNRRRKLI